MLSATPQFLVFTPTIFLEDPILNKMHKNISPAKDQISFDNKIPGHTSAAGT